MNRFATCAAAVLVLLAGGSLPGDARAQAPSLLDPMAAPGVADRAAPARSPDRSDVLERPIWKRITLGGFRGVNAVRAALENARVRIGDSADEVMGRPAFRFSPARTDVDLVVVTVSELGFARPTSIADIYWRAGEIGFELCAPEVAPLLRLQYANQPVGEFLHVAMRPVTTYGGDPVSLTVGNAGTGPLLIGGSGQLDLMMSLDSKLVFVRPQRIALPDLR